jgi:hypothetical protein
MSFVVKRREIQTLHCSKRFNFPMPTQPRISFERAILTCIDFFLHFGGLCEEKQNIPKNIIIINTYL